MQSIRNEENITKGQLNVRGWSYITAKLSIHLKQELVAIPAIGTKANLVLLLNNKHKTQVLGDMGPQLGVCDVQHLLQLALNGCKI